MDHTKKKTGIGTGSLLLVVVGIVWAFSFFGFCLGDKVLGALGVPAWSNGTEGIHFTVYYSLIFFGSAFLIGRKYKNDFGADCGKISALVMGAIIILSVFFLAI